MERPKCGGCIHWVASHPHEPSLGNGTCHVAPIRRDESCYSDWPEVSASEAGCALHQAFPAFAASEADRAARDAASEVLGPLGDEVAP